MPNTPYGQNADKQQRDSKSEELLSGAKGVAASVAEAGGDAAKYVEKKAADVREVAEEKTEELMAWIKGRPVQSVLIGAAIGYLLGRMARR